MIPLEELTCLTCYVKPAVSGYALCYCCLGRVTPTLKPKDTRLAVEEVNRILAEGQEA